MKHHLPQSSPVAPATESDSNANKELDFDQIRSINNMRDRLQDERDRSSSTASIMDNHPNTHRHDNRERDDRDDSRSNCETHTLRITYRLGNLKIESRVRFYIIHHEDTARVTYVTDYQPDRTVEHSVDSARELYRILRRRGYYSF